MADSRKPARVTILKNTIHNPQQLAGADAFMAWGFGCGDNSVCDNIRLLVS